MPVRWPWQQLDTTAEGKKASGELAYQPGVIAGQAAHVEFSFLAKAEAHVAADAVGVELRNAEPDGRGIADITRLGDDYRRYEKREAAELT